MMQALLAVVLLMLLPWTAEAQYRQAAPAQAQPKVFRDCPSCPEMVVVPAGEFLMGSPETEIGRDKNEGPQHKVVIAQPFAVGKYEVTFAEWDACVAEGGCSEKPGDEGWGRGRHPVVNVSWNDANEYTAWLSKKTGKRYRLLSEAEWEYAARGTTKITDKNTPFSTGVTINYRQANYDANFTYASGQQGLYRQKTVDVGTLPRNAFGLYEMHGNVWEWVQDCYKPNYEGAPTDGSPVMTQDCRLRILRGGAWNYHPRLLRSAYRYATAPEVRLNNAGFRVARSL
ncbi:MAG TPA: formylglycine-generating enzyme family protein [Hyphomicrobiales bacterium]|nr:formylglycine-generating enzyme family protein [Hyphomicrobiales bacterium]